MKIAIVTNWFPAGAGYVSKAYRETLKHQQSEVYIYARGGVKMQGNSSWDDEFVTWAPLRNGRINISHLLRWIYSNNIDCVLFNEQRYWKPLVELKKNGIFIGAYIDYYTQQSVPAFAIYDFLLCNTERHYSVFNWHNNVYYIPWGTDVEKFKPHSEKQNDYLKFIISAGWQLSKNGDRRGSIIALDAFIKTKGKAELYFYSQVKFENTPPVFREKINSDKRIIFHYGTFDPFPFWKGDVYLYPSRLDGIGLTLPEALSSGLAVITTDCAPMTEFVKNNYNGITVPVEKYMGRHDGYYWAESLVNSSELIKAIQNYIDNVNIVTVHQENARKNALINLNWMKNSGQLLEILQQVSLKGVSSNLDSKLISLCLKLDESTAPSLKVQLQKIIISIKRELHHLIS